MTTEQEQIEAQIKTDVMKELGGKLAAARTELMDAIQEIQVVIPKLRAQVEKRLTDMSETARITVADALTYAFERADPRSAEHDEQE